MPLVPQTIDIPFEGGLDTATDPKKVVPGKLLELENAVFVGGSIEMRPGTALLGEAVVGGGTLTTALDVAQRAGELLRWTTAGVYGLNPAGTGQWLRRADAVAARNLRYGLRSVVRRPRSALNFDAASLLGITVYAWSEVNPYSGFPIGGERSVRVTVINDATGARYLDAVVLANETYTTAHHPIQVRVVATGGQVVVLYGLTAVDNTVTLHAAKVRPGTPTAPLVSVPITTTIVRDTSKVQFYTFDAVDISTASPSETSPGALVLGYGAADGIRLSFLTTTAAADSYAYLGETLRTPATGAASATQYRDVRVARLADGTRVFAVFTQTRTGRLEVHPVDVASRVAVGSGDLGTHVTGRVAFAEQTPGVVTAFIERTGESALYQPLTRAAFNGNGVVSGQTAWVYGARLLGDGFLVGGAWVVPCLVLDIWTNGNVGPDLPGVQPSILLVDASTGVVVGHALDGMAGAPFTGSHLLQRPAHRADGATVLVVPARGEAVFDDDSGALVDETPYGLARMMVQPFDSDLVGRVAPSGLHVGGACPAYYDGASWVEEGFLERPEGVTVYVDPGNSNGNLSAGTYSWTVCYEWRDSLGRLHRSAPSVPKSIDVDGSSAQSQVAIRVPYLTLTRKRGVVLSLYRTQVNGTVFQRVAQSKDAEPNPDPGTMLVQSHVVLYDGASDSDIADNEVLAYGGPAGGVTGGELWHTPPPAYSAIHQHQDYLFTNSMEEPYTYAHSLPMRDGEGPAWAAELSNRIPESHGRLVGFGSVDGALVLLAEQGCFAVYGRGPLSNGLDNGFTEPILLQGSVGCVNAASIVATPDGVAFQAPDGFYLVARGLDTVKLGAPVDAFAGLTVTRGLEVRTATSTQQPSGRWEVRWYTREGMTLVYSHTFRQWATWTSQPSRGAVVVEGVAHFADGTKVRREDAALATEAGSTFAMVVGTAWLKWAGIQGAQRVWKANLLGRADVTAQLAMLTLYDYDDTPPFAAVSDVFTGASVGGPKVFAIRHTLGRQRCESVRFRWTVTPMPTSTSDKGRVVFTALTLEVGMDRAPSKRYGRKLGP